MNKILLIGIGSGLGGMCRYWISNAFYTRLGSVFPYGTLAVNTLGCFMMGLLFIVLIERFNGISELLRALLLIGFLGGFTTFSSFTIETVNLAENGQWLLALLNVLASVIICLSFTWLGVLLGRQL